MKVEIITDLRIIKAICNKYSFKYDKVYKYITEHNNFIGTIKHKNENYKLQYVDGCFYPYIAKIL